MERHALARISGRPGPVDDTVLGHRRMVAVRAPCHVQLELDVFLHCSSLTVYREPRRAALRNRHPLRDLVYELQPDLDGDSAKGRCSSRVVANITRRSTKVIVPSDVFRSGRLYHLRVSAFSAERDFAEPGRVKSAASDRTSVITAPFRSQ